MSFDLDSLINFIKDKENIKIISLQFSPEFQKNFQEDFYEKLKLLFPKNKKLYIIGDTSYSQCCCDETTAMHLKTDIIIRIGSGCFTQNKKMPIYYLIDNIDFTEEQLLQFKFEFFGKLESKLKVEKNVENILFFYNEKFQKTLIFKIKNEFFKEIKEKYSKNIYFSEINIADYDQKTKNKIIYEEGEILYGRQIKPKLNKKIDKSFLLVYLGINSDEKLLYESLLENPEAIRNFIKSVNKTFLDSSCHFVENHDLERIVGSFGGNFKKAMAAGTIGATVGGMIFINHGQWEGKKNRLIVNLRRAVDEDDNVEVKNYYRKLNQVLKEPAFRSSNIYYIDNMTGDKKDEFISYIKEEGDNHFLVVVNYSENKGCVKVPIYNIKGYRYCLLYDALNSKEFAKEIKEVRNGMEVCLEEWESKIFRYNY